MGEEKRIGEGMEPGELHRYTNVIASTIGLSRWDVPRHFVQTENFGICNTCKLFGVARSKYKVLVAKCAEYNMRLQSEEPVVECTAYDEIGRPSLTEMVEMALDINPSDKKIGFIK